ncbi:hypothetical protein HDU93_004315 [Gonapodya sp. JEL0774]|nr:hypothetical protein HDU93_004315 [Gonapodya sp. JEL0774]
MRRLRKDHPTSLPTFPKYPLPNYAHAFQFQAGSDSATSATSTLCAADRAFESFAPSQYASDESASLQCTSQRHSQSGSIALPSQINTYSVTEVVTHPAFLKPAALFVVMQAVLFLVVRKAWIWKRRRSSSASKAGQSPSPARVDPLLDPSFERKTSWILTTLSSAVMTMAGLLGFFGWALHGWDMARWPLIGTTRISLWIAIYFLTYMWCDIAIGLVYYRSQITFLAGYVHHTLFTLIFLFAIYHGLVACILPFCLLELPTLVMALGQLDKRYRRDLVFGGTYFGTRVAMHAALCASIAGELEVGIMVWPLPSIVLPLHIYWFHKWVKQQQRLRTKRRVEEKEKDVQKNSDAISKRVAGEVDGGSNGTVPNGKTTFGGDKKDE